MTPNNKNAQGRPPTELEMPLTSPGPGKVFCHITQETLERTPSPLGNWVHPISQEMRSGLKIRGRKHFSQFAQALTWSSWQPLLL